MQVFEECPKLRAEKKIIRRRLSDTLMNRRAHLRSLKVLSPKKLRHVAICSYVVYSVAVFVEITKAIPSCMYILCSYVCMQLYVLPRVHNMDLWYYLQLTNSYTLSIEWGHLKGKYKGQVHLCRRASHYPNCLSSQLKAMIMTLFQGKSQFAMQVHSQTTIQVIMKMYSYVDNCINISIIC